jgi:hypothetical protein
VQLRSDIADLIVQHPIDHRMHVFVGRQGSRSSKQLLANSGKSALDFLALSNGQSR